MSSKKQTGDISVISYIHALLATSSAESIELVKQALTSMKKLAFSTIFSLPKDITPMGRPQVSLVPVAWFLFSALSDAECTFTPSVVDGVVGIWQTEGKAILHPLVFGC